MDACRFDRFTRWLAHGRFSRRQALAIGGGTGISLLSTSGATAAPATPAVSATPVVGPSLDVLFTQSFEAGSFVPVAGAAAAYTLTLRGVPAVTVWFADRPERQAGIVQTADLLDGRAFAPADPPNAAIVAQTGRSTDTLVVELRNPRYDAGARTVVYDARVIANYEREGLAFLARQQDDHAIAEQFGPGSLFLDNLGCLGTRVPPSPNNDCSQCCTGTCYVDPNTGVNLCT